MLARQTLASWKKLNQLALDKKSQHMNTLFAEDSKRFDKFSIELPRLLLDYSKNLIDDETMSTLFELAKESEVTQWREKMFSVKKLIKQNIEPFYIPH